MVSSLTELQRLKIELEEARNARNNIAKTVRQEFIKSYNQKRERDNLTDSIVGACTCMTKPPEPEYHMPGCKYRIIMERDKALEDKKNLLKILNNISEAKSEEELKELIRTTMLIYG